MRCVYDDYLAVLEYLREVNHPLFEQALWPHRRVFLERKWIWVAGYGEGQTIETDDGWVEDVTHDIDVIAQTYKYVNPNWRGQVLVRPLEEITFYSLCIERFLDDLAGMIGIADVKRAKKAEVIAGHLWSLGQLRLENSSQFANIFVARIGSIDAQASIKAYIDDEFLPGQAIVLVNKVSKTGAMGQHLERCLSDFMETQGEESHFRLDKLQRILQRHASAESTAHKDVVTDTHVHLRHLPDPMELSPGQIALVRHAWGADQ